MKLYDAQGLPKDATSADSSSTAGRALASGYIEPLALDVDGLAVSQALGVPADTDGIATAQAPSASVALSLQPAAANLVPARKVTLTSAANLSAINFTIVGTSESGSDVDEVLSGPNAGTVTSSNYYSSVTSITPDASNGSNVEAGWPNSAAAFPLHLISAGSELDPTRRVTLTSTDNLSTVTFTVVGTDEDDAPQTEDIAGPNNNTVTGLLRYKTVTSITPDLFPQDDVSAGWPAETVNIYESAAGSLLTHFYLNNINAITQTVRITLRIGGVMVPWKTFVFLEDESASVLAYEPEFPLEAGDAIFATTTTSGAVSFSIHGSES